MVLLCISEKAPDSFLAEWRKGVLDVFSEWEEVSCKKGKVCVYCLNNCQKVFCSKG